ncbi:MAG: hypothetical protein UMV23_02750 [Halanaerobium sp.]|nr:hypothetical protein [Halanaerobium sp.]
MIEEQLAGIEDSDVPGSEKYLEQYRGIKAELEGELAELTPAERQSPAWIGSKSESRYSFLVPAGTEQAVPLVCENEVFFSRDLPPTAFQSLLILQGKGKGDSFFGQVHHSFYDNIDWAALAELLQP